MKRVLTFLLALILVFSMIPGVALRADAEGDYTYAGIADDSLVEVEMAYPELFPDLRPDDSKPKAFRAPMENEMSNTFMDYLMEKFAACKSNIDVEQFNIPSSRWEELRSVIWYEMPELFHIYGLGCSYNSSTGVIAAIGANYRPFADDAAEYQTCLDKMLDGAEYLLQGIKDNNDLTDVEKALLLHDRLAVWTEYDLGNMYTSDSSHKIFTAYSALGEGLSVCQGYAMAYMYLLDQVGIDSDYCSSDALNHGWNIVYIDGVSYHVDVTWDDPVNDDGATYYDDYGRVLHDNFLLSSDGIWNSGHEASDYNNTPNDSRYDSKNTTTWWMDSNTAVQMIDNDLYYLDENNGKVICADDGSTIYTPTDFAFSRKLSATQSVLLCSTNESVQVIDPKTGASSVVYTTNSGYIEGMKYEKGKLCIQFNDGNGNSRRESIEYVDPEPENTDYTYTVENGEATITGYTGVGGDITIPAELDGYPVTAIGNNAFREYYSLSSVVFPDCVTVIGVNAFWECKRLISVKLPANLTTIGDFAFYRCESLAAVTIPDSVTAIGDYAFQMCWSLPEITIPGSVKQMYEGVFQDCKALRTVVIEEGVPIICDVMFGACKALQSIIIPKSVTAIEYLAFASCDSLTDIYYAGTKAQWDAITINEDNSGLDGATIHYAGHTHEYSKKVTKPTCTAKGYTTYTCECGDTYKADYVNAKGHTYSKGKCTVCSYKPKGAKITAQPKNVAVSSGKTAKVSVKASGDGLKYTWYYAKKGSSKYTKTTVTSASYSVKMSSSVNGRKVYCVVTDKYGNSVKSSTVTLYKGTPAKIKTQPKGITVANGKTGKLEIKASGSSLKYQWYVKYKGASSFTKVGKSSKTYSFKMASKLSGAQAYCVVKDKYGIEVKSSMVTIKLAPVPKITTQPKSVTQVSGKTVKFSVKASGDGLKYQWYYAKKGSSSFKKVSGAKSATYSVKVSSSVNGRKYYCLVTDKYGQTLKSSQVTLTMKTVAKITTQPKSVTVKNGKTAKVTIKAVGDGLKYTWYYLKPGATKYVKATATGTSYSVKMTAAWKNAKVYCAISDKYGNTVKSSVVTLKMK